MINEIEIYYCVVENEFPELSFKRLLETLPFKVKSRIQRFRRWEDAHACLIGHLLVERFIMGKNGSWEDFYTNLYGKPYIIDRPFFNVTHSEKLIALATADFEIGIDAEMIRDYDYISIIDNIASELDKQRIFDSSDPLVEFYRYWTQKEACLKQIGKGLTIPMKSVEICGNDVAYVDGKMLKIINVETSLERYILNVAVPYDLFKDTAELTINPNLICVSKCWSI